jgi:hypothetical protein
MRCGSASSLEEVEGFDGLMVGQRCHRAWDIRWREQR